MLKLTYCRKSDEFQTVTVLGDEYGIRDLYWQLTHNYIANDGTEICNVSVSSLDGYDCTKTVMAEPFCASTYLSRLE